MKARSTRERLLDSCDHSDPDECWPWTAACTLAGTPLYSLWTKERRRTTRTARRMMWHEFVGAAIPDGIVVIPEPMCEKLCVNPAHLRLGTRKEAAALNPPRRRRPTHCQRGHEFTEENTYRDGRGHRQCRACQKLRRDIARFG